MAKVYRHQGSIVAVETDGKTEYFSARNGDAYKFLLVGNYANKGYEIEPSLLALYEKDVADRNWVQTQRERHENTCIEQAITTGKPVVISSCGYATTASVGANYAIAMPNGHVWSARNGNSRSSHGDRVGYSIDVCGVSDSDYAAVVAAIREYNS
jgi:hypothetical protein